MNNDGGGSASERKATTGGDPLALILTDDEAEDSDGDEIPRFVKNASSFVSTRNSSKMFYSTADAKKRCGTALASKSSDIPTSAGSYYPADLFAGFAPSLAELDPEGNPKIQLPRRSELLNNNWQTKDWTALVRRSFRAMVAIFARGRIANGGDSDATNYGKDQFTFFQNAGHSYSLSRAALATVALLDGLDADFIPGKSASPLCNYWAYLPTVSAYVTGNSGNRIRVSEGRPDLGSSDPLNYPCTESAPLLSSVYAWIEINPQATLSGTGNNQKKIYNAKLHVGARAICQNKTTENNPHSGQITLEWEVMEGTPSANTVTGGSDATIRNTKVELGGSGFNSTKSIEWKGFFTSGSCTSPSATVNDGSTMGRQISAVGEVQFQIVCSFDPANSALQTWGGFYPPTQAELNDEPGDVLVPIRMKVTITGDGGTIQQVPAPAISSGSKDYWLRVSPAVWHGKSSTYGGNKTGSPRGPYGSLGQLAWGWAICAAPAFGFDTSSLVTIPGSNPGEEKPVGSTMGFWINDIIARNEGGGGGFHGGGVGGGRFQPFISDFFQNSAANARAQSEFAGGGFRDSIWNYAQYSWLFNSDNNYDNVLNWMNKSSGRHLPDMLHCFKKGGSPFLTVGSALNRLPSELYSRIPAMGYGNAADLGTVMCGPYETLSLFKTWRLGGGQADFHPVVDYFTTDRDRYPDRKEITDAVSSEGEVDWTKLSGEGTASDPYKDLYSAVHNGRVNLNAPPLVAATKIANGVSVRGDATEFRNPYPIAAVFNGAPYPSTASGSTVTNAINEATALILATDFCRMLEDSQLGEAKARSDVFNGHTRQVVRNLSFLGAGNDGGSGSSYKDRNKLLEDFILLAQPRDDNERESLIRGTVDGFTTRGQTYLLIIRADAYSPKFGENDSVEDGTTLATTHAVVELFRDPAPARAPNGSFPSDGVRPVAYHNWYVRSFRVF